MSVYAIQGGGATSLTSQGCGWNEEVCFTLNKTEVHGIAIIRPPSEHMPESITTFPLDGMNHTDRPQHHPIHPPDEMDPSYTLNTSSRHGVVIVRTAEECMKNSTLSSAGVPANLSASPVLEKDWTTLVGISPSPTSLLSTSIDRNGSSGKTSPASCHLREDETLEPSSGRWKNSGMGTHGECWTLSLPEHPYFPAPFLSDDGVCSLSEILETGDVPRRYYLSQKACAGILRRAARKSRPLPDLLKRALEAVAGPTWNAEQESVTPSPLDTEPPKTETEGELP